MKKRFIPLMLSLALALSGSLTAMAAPDGEVVNFSIRGSYPETIVTVPVDGPYVDEIETPELTVIEEEAADASFEIVDEEVVVEEPAEETPVTDVDALYEEPVDEEALEDEALEEDALSVEEEIITVDESDAEAATNAAHTKHSFKTLKTEYATYGKDGWQDKACACGELSGKKKVIYAPSKVTLGAASFVYPGKTVTAKDLTKLLKIKVLDKKNKSISNKLYTVSADRTVNGPGNYTLTVSFIKGAKGQKYEGSMPAVPFKVSIDKPKGLSVKAKKTGGITVTVKKPSKALPNGAGYELQYSTNANASGNATKINAATGVLEIPADQLKANTTYYFKVKSVAGEFDSDFTKIAKLKYTVKNPVKPTPDPKPDPQPDPPSAGTITELVIYKSVGGKLQDMTASLAANNNVLNIEPTFAAYTIISKDLAEKMIKDNLLVKGRLKDNKLIDLPSSGWKVSGVGFVNTTYTVPSNYTCDPAMARSKTIRVFPVIKYTGSTNPANPTEADARRIILDTLKLPGYTEGSPWTDETHVYYSQGMKPGPTGVLTMALGTGCAALSSNISDRIFGSRNFKIHTNINNVKVGDIVRYRNDAHEGIVYEVSGTVVKTVDGNASGTVFVRRDGWDLTDPAEGFSYVLTRW